MPLSDLVCRAAKPKARDYKLSDSDALYLLVKPTGSKLWRMNYRFHGRQKTLSIGVYPKTGLASARAARDAAKDSLARGLDPSGKKPEANIVTFEKMAREWFGNRRTRWVPAYAERVWSRFADDVLPAFGDKAVDAITPLEVLEMLRKIEDRGALDVAKRVRQVVSRVFRYTVALGHRADDPASPIRDAMQAAPRPVHMPALREPDLPEFFKRLRAYDGEKQTRLAIEFVVHTFVRTGEIRFAKWSEFGGAIWRIPAERMKIRKEHIVPLSTHVQALVAQLRQEARGSELVVPNIELAKPISENTMLFALYRMGYASRATIHGFRSTASTILNESRLWHPDVIERQLAHTPKNEVRSAYNAALYLDERIRMMTWYSDYLLKQDGDLSDVL